MEDGSVNHILVGHDDIVHLLTDEGGGRTSFGVCVVVEGVDNLGEFLFGFLVKVGDFDTCGEDGIVGVLCGEGCGGLGGKFVEFGGGDAWVYSLDYLLGDDGFVDKLFVECAWTVDRWTRMGRERVGCEQ